MEDDVSLKEKDAPDEQRLLTEEDIKEFEEKYDMAEDFIYIIETVNLLAGKTFLNNGCLDCSLNL